jgi:uncharacterized membrane protein YhhN
MVAYGVPLALYAQRSVVRTRRMETPAERTAARVGVLGAVLFLVSDSLLSWNAFRAPVPFADLCILSTYYASQLCLALSVLLLPLPPAKTKDA